MVKPYRRLLTTPRVYLQYPLTHATFRHASKKSAHASISIPWISENRYRPHSPRGVTIYECRPIPLRAGRECLRPLRRARAIFDVLQFPGPHARRQRDRRNAQGRSIKDDSLLYMRRLVYRRSERRVKDSSASAEGVIESWERNLYVQESVRF